MPFRATNATTAFPFAVSHKRVTTLGKLRETKPSATKEKAYTTFVQRCDAERQEAKRSRTTKKERLTSSPSLNLLWLGLSKTCLRRYALAYITRPFGENTRVIRYTHSISAGKRGESFQNVKTPPLSARMIAVTSIAPRKIAIYK